MVLWVPVIAAIQFVLMLGLSMFLSALTVFYRDIGIVIGHLMRLLFYVAPILWSFDADGGRGALLHEKRGRRRVRDPALQPRRDPARVVPDRDLRRRPRRWRPLAARAGCGDWTCRA